MVVPSSVLGRRRRISQKELPVVKLTPAQHVCRLCSRFTEDYCVFVYLLPRLTAASLPQVSKHYNECARRTSQYRLLFGHSHIRMRVIVCTLWL